MHFNFKEEVTLNKANYSHINPINKKNVKRKKINGTYIYEQFYLIDFFGIKQNSYVISSFGRIFSLISDKELIPYPMKKRNNYTTIQLCCENGKTRRFPLHVLVAVPFVPKIDEDKKQKRIYVHHKNWDNDYNYYWNLEWRSPLEIMMIGRAQTNPDITEDELVKIACILLEKETTLSDIWIILQGQLSMNKLKKIKNRTMYINITKNYHF